jgi:hypothetical protein
MKTMSSKTSLKSKIFYIRPLNKKLVVILRDINFLINGEYKIGVINYILKKGDRITRPVEGDIVIMDYIL